MKPSSDRVADPNAPLSGLSAEDVHEHVIYRDAETNAVISDPNAPTYNEKFAYLISGQQKKWQGSVIKWRYNPAGQPSIFRSEEVVNAIIEATERWTAVCGIKFEYQGHTTAVPQFSSCDDISSVGWGPLNDNVMGYAMACYRGSYFDQLDVMFDNIEPLQIHNLDWLKITAVHEFGHILGLGHTDISNAVMYSWLNQRHPISDDIEGCQSLYGAANSTPAPVCNADSVQSCSVSNGYGERVCNSAGSGYDTCQAKSCNTGYSLQNGSCVQNAPPPVCNAGTKQSCNISNGYGERTCNSVGSAYGSCQVKSCNSGYTLQNGSCVANTPSQNLYCSPNSTKTCSVFNGTGVQTCNASGTAYSSCQMTACNPGHYQFFGFCFRSWR